MNDTRLIRRAARASPRATSAREEAAVASSRAVSAFVCTSNAMFAMACNARTLALLLISPSEALSAGLAMLVNDMSISDDLNEEWG